METPKPILARIPSFFAIVLAGGLGLAACGGGGGGGTNDGTGLVGDASMAARTATIDPGDDDCPYGGVLVETGIDENGNGVLDEDEVDTSKKVCNGAPGVDGEDGLDAMVNISDEPPGANCANGGVRIDVGTDIDGDGSLDAAKITRTDYVCNGAPGVDGEDGLNAVMNTSEEPPGANCANGGVRIDVGTDIDGDGILDAAEITSTDYVCNGAPGDAGWGVSIAMESYLDRNTKEPEVAANAAGRVVVVWAQFGGSDYDVWANLYVPGQGWTGPERISDSSTNDQKPHVAVDTAGNAVVVWESNGNIMASRHVPGVGWETPQSIETSSESAYDPQVAVDADGNAVAVWRQRLADGRTAVMANRYSPDSGWGSAEQIDLDPDPGTGYPADSMDITLAMNADGTAMAVWRQQASDYLGTYGTVYKYKVWGNRYVPGVGWGGPKYVPLDAGSISSSPQAAVYSDGTAVVVWGQDGSIWTSRYGPLGRDPFTGQLLVGWDGAETIENDDSMTADAPHIAVDPDDNAVAVWEQGGSIWANRYVPGAGWGQPEIIETGHLSASDPRVAVDANGSAVAVWHQPLEYTNYYIWANRYVPGVGWGRAELIQYENEGTLSMSRHYSTVRVAVDAAGNAVAVWRQYDPYQTDTNEWHIWANRYTAP